MFSIGNDLHLPVQHARQLPHEIPCCRDGRVPPSVMTVLVVGHFGGFPSIIAADSRKVRNATSD